MCVQVSSSRFSHVSTWKVTKRQGDIFCSTQLKNKQIIRITIGRVKLPNCILGLAAQSTRRSPQPTRNATGVQRRNLLIFHTAVPLSRLSRLHGWRPFARLSRRLPCAAEPKRGRSLFIGPLHKIVDRNGLRLFTDFRAENFMLHILMPNIIIIFLLD